MTEKEIDEFRKNMKLIYDFVEEHHTKWRKMKTSDLIFSGFRFGTPEQDLADRIKEESAFHAAMGIKCEMSRVECELVGLRDEIKVTERELAIKQKELKICEAWAEGMVDKIKEIKND